MLRTKWLLILVWALFSAAACSFEVKPVLKAAEPDIPTRIASQQKNIDNTVASKELTLNDVKPFQTTLDQIRRKYEQLQKEGRLTPKEIKSINSELDSNGDELFKKKQVRKRPKF